MDYTTIISPADLFSQLYHPDWAVFDCRFDFNNPVLGRERYLYAHIPGAVFADIEQDLSDPPIEGVTGRHPLPSIEKTAQTFSGWGIDDKVQVVVYDDVGGAYAARMWFMLRWLGHTQVAVLDGGYPAWEKSGFPVGSGMETRLKRDFLPQPRSELLVDVNQVESVRQDANYKLIDARATERYLGLVEPYYARAGHIPGAVSLPYAENLTPEGAFLPPEVLRQRFFAVMGDTPVEQVVMYCGSGVTANHNLIAMLYAGLGEARLFPGSWSEWITDPLKPIA